MFDDDDGMRIMPDVLSADKKAATALKEFASEMRRKHDLLADGSTFIFNPSLLELVNYCKTFGPEPRVEQP